jgi:hypothetical protein
MTAEAVREGAHLLGEAPFTFGDWRAMAHEHAQQVKDNGFCRVPHLALFDALEALRLQGEELPDFWADYLIDVWGKAPNMYQLAGDYYTHGELSPRRILGEVQYRAELLAGKDRGIARLLGQLRLEPNDFNDLQRHGRNSIKINKMPHVKTIEFWQELIGCPHRLNESGEQSYGEALANACRNLERLHWGAGDCEGIRILNLDRILSACPNLRTVTGALPMLEDAPQIKSVSIRQAYLYNEVERVERRLDRLGPLENLQLTQVREISGRWGAKALERVGHIRATVLGIGGERHTAHRYPQESLVWIKDAALAVGASIVYITGTPHTVAHVTRAFKGTGLLVRWETPKAGKPEREQQF